MKKTAKLSFVLPGEQETITCEVVGEYMDGCKVWAEVLECGHHDGLYFFRYGVFCNAEPLDGWEWDSYENYSPCDCWGFDEGLNSWK